MDQSTQRIYSSADRDDYELMRALVQQRAEFPQSYQTVLRAVALYRHDQAPSQIRV